MATKSLAAGYCINWVLEHASVGPRVKFTPLIRRSRIYKNLLCDLKLAVDIWNFPFTKVYGWLWTAKTRGSKTEDKREIPTRLNKTDVQV